MWAKSQFNDSMIWTSTIGDRNVVQGPRLILNPDDDDEVAEEVLLFVPEKVYRNAPGCRRSRVGGEKVFL